MKLYCLSGHPSKPCCVLKFKNTTILLDCGLDMTTALNFLPLPLVHSGRLNSLPSWLPRDANDAIPEGEIRDCCGRLYVDSPPEFCVPQSGVVNFSQVDVILISNYSCMMALPYITEHTDFHGVVYATEPTLQIGGQFMEEVLHYIERTPKPKCAHQWKNADVLKLLPPPLCDAFKPRTWRQWFNSKDLHSSLARVQTVGFSERLDVFGALNITPISSGFCLGSCNWIIRSEYETIAYISGSSTLTTHPRPMEQAPLKNADVLILCGLTQTPVYDPDAMLGEFCAAVASTLRNGGNVLVPCYSSGVTYDLFECLSSHLDNQGLSSVPLVFVSPMADSSLAYSNIYAEWLSQGKQSKVYLPEEPFPHAQLVRNNRLKHFPNLHAEGFSTQFRSPCVMFTGHPSLRFGDAVHFMELWGGSQSNTVIFTEPDFMYLEALGPFQPLAMKAVYCPIDTSLNFNQANKLIRDLKPRHLVVPVQYTSAPVLQPHRSDLTIDCENKTITFQRGDVLNLPIRRAYEKMELDPELAASIVPVEIKRGVSLATLTGSLIARDNKYILKAIQAQPVVGRKRKREEHCYSNAYTWGALDIEEFVSRLSRAGIKDAKVEESPTGFIIHLQKEDTIIRVEQNLTHIFCSSDEQLRCTLKDILLQCLNKF